MKVLAHFVNREGKVRLGVRQILKGTDHTLILGGILWTKGIAFMSRELLRSGQRSRDRLTRKHADSTKDISSIFFLGENNAIGCLFNFNA
jgi:hypothetical protein